MHTKYLLTALAAALSAAAAEFAASASEYPETVDTDDTIDSPQITPTQIAASEADQGELEFDSTGLPWDERIHASTKTKTAAGIWTKRRGVDDATVARVTAELRAIYPDATLTVPAAASAPAPAAAPTITAPVISAPVVTAAPITNYSKLVDFVAKNFGADKALNQEWVDGFFSSNGTTLPALAADEEKSELFLTTLRKVFTDNNLTEAV